MASTTTAFAGESGRLAVKSVHAAPALIVFQTWPAPPVNPMTVTYAVAPLAFDESIAAADTGNSFALILPAGPLLVTLAKLVLPAVALVVTQTCPPAGEENEPS